MLFRDQNGLLNLFFNLILEDSFGERVVSLMEIGFLRCSGSNPALTRRRQLISFRLKITSLCTIKIKLICIYIYIYI